MGDVYKGNPERLGQNKLFIYYLDKKALHITSKPPNALVVYPVLKYEGATDKEEVPGEINRVLSPHC